jgi:hypothetical protein
MKFFIETGPLTGNADVMDVVFIGHVWCDSTFVVEAETEDEAAEKLLDLLTKRVCEGQIRPATNEEAEAFTKWQKDDLSCYEFARRSHEKYVKGLGNEQANQA